MTTAAELTQPDVARLMGLLTSETVKALIRAIDSEACAGRISWAAYRNAPDTFGRSLAGQIRNARRLSNRQIGAAKGRLLQRNWTQVVHVLARGLVTVPGVTLESATDAARQAPTYSQRNGSGTTSATTPRVPRDSRGQPRRTRTPVPAPAAPADSVLAPSPIQARLCGKKLAYTYDGQKCTRTAGHRNGCIGERPNTPQAPTNDVDSALASLGVRSAAMLPPSRGAGEQFMDEDDARVTRFKLLDLDDEPSSYVEPEYDPTVERFKLLDLD